MVAHMACRLHPTNDTVECVVVPGGDGGGGGGQQLASGSDTECWTAVYLHNPLRAPNVPITLSALLACDAHRAAALSWVAVPLSQFVSSAAASSPCKKCLGGGGGGGRLARPGTQAEHNNMQLQVLLVMPGPSGQVGPFCTTPYLPACLLGAHE